MELENLSTFRIAVIDQNGQWRGKRVPGSYASKLNNGGLRMPLSASNVDIWGTDTVGSPRVFESGDGDGPLYATGRGPVPMPWLENATALVPMWLFTDDGAPFEGDPRHALASVLKRYENKGLTVIAATEMEFTLVDDSGAALVPPKHPINGRRLNTSSVVALDELDAFDAFFTDIYDCSAQMGIPAQTAVTEAGIGQFEVTLNHQDAMRTADDAVLFKTLVRGLARKHGMAATFMAKPYADDAGNGMHVHFSVLDQAGNNVFNNETEEGSDTLRHAVAGCLAAMSASTLIFAPHGNSYDRMVSSAHAPTSVCWGYENRTAAIRIPGGPNVARRVEHRVAGGDINPYLMLAVVLGAAIEGMDSKMQPPAPITGNAYEQQLPQLAPDWTSAIDSFENDPMIARILPQELIRDLAMTKRQEMREMVNIAPHEQWQTWLERV
jgi:glutamine synthetase